MVNEFGATGHSPVARDYTVRKVNGRAKCALQQYPTCGLRPGPAGYGAFSNCSKTPPAAMGRFATLDVSAILGCPRKAWRQPIVKTGAYPGARRGVLLRRLSRTSELLEAADGAFPRPDGDVSKGREASKTRHLTQRAKFGHCPCCAIATPVALLINYWREDVDSLKSQGTVAVALRP